VCEKETFIYEKRPMYMRRDIYIWIEAYVCGKKNPLTEPNMRVCLVCERDRVETCIYEKRPIHMKKRPIYK